MGVEICDDCKHQRGIGNLNNACCAAQDIMALWRVHKLHGKPNTDARQGIKKVFTSSLGHSAKELSEFREKVSAHIQMMLESTKRKAVK